MILKIIGVLIGILLVGFGGYYLIKEKKDKESRKIYGITTVVGVILLLASALLLFL